MKYNQYAYLKTDYKTKINELRNIRFLDSNWEKASFSELLRNLIKACLVEATSSQAKEAKLNEFAVNDTETLTDFLAKKPTTISRNEFYNVALQLLGYHVGYDYSLTDPLDRMKRNALPFTDQENIDKAELINVFYRLLNTRAKNGQTLIDNLAGKGYFTQFYPINDPMYFNGKALPVFDTSKIIREVVYVESDLDTDEDGKSDLLQVTIFRPIESNNFKIPALYTADPYFGGVILNATTMLILI